MQALIEVILPVFLVIGAGYAASWRGLFGPSAVEGTMHFAQTFAVPVLLFVSILHVDLGQDYDLRLLVSFYAGAFACFGLGYLGALRLFARPATDAVAIGFCCLFANSLLLGIPITQRAYGEDAIAGNLAIISVHSPLLYSFGITVMEMTRARGTGLSVGRVLLRSLRAVLRTPLVIGIGSGLIVNLSGLPLPEVLEAATSMIARAALPVALFALGGVLFQYRPEGDMRTIAMICLLSLVVHPAITFGLARFGFGLDAAALRSGTLTAAMAPGVNTYLFANMYGAARRVAASSVLIATAASVATVWVWLALLP
ncbi:AEC family transporter [Frigidibacter oleivorans]|uniref:AEC family transporter n=1 Tax=Frigidibacter oleivorans TaxID=2487129 RepID=UPI000F8DE6AE|nr:AEC family transporter [Frigidibacter oleivorans]